MAEPGAGVTRLFLQPAGVVLSETPTQIRTVLGSCVAITMRAPRLGLAAVSHCVLPKAGATAGQMGVAEALKYVDTAIDLMLLAFANNGVDSGEIEVKLFGGAEGMASAVPSGSYSVGSRNIEAALEALHARGIVPAASGVGGRLGRVIDFDTVTGDVIVRMLPGRGDGGVA